MSLQVIIPFFNESKRISSHIEILKSLIVKNRLDIIYVDDGSSDNSDKLLEQQLNLIKSDNFSFKILIQQKNQGKGFAVKRGVSEVSSRYCMFTDFDFSIDPTQIFSFYEEAIQVDGHVLIMASRKEESEVVKAQSPLRRILGSCFNKAMKLIINLPFKDTQCGFKMFDTKTAKDIFSRLQTKGFAFDVEIIKRAYDKNVTIIEKGVKITNDDENSTVNIFFDPIKMIWELTKLRISLSKLKNG